MGTNINVERWFTGHAEYVNERLQGFLLIVTAIMITAQCGYLVTIPSATGYETSLVLAFPLVFWILFYASLAFGIVVVLSSLVTRSAYWQQGIALLLCNYALFFFLPLARGYKMYGRGQADILAHLADVKAILATGTIPGTWYPAEHVLMTELAMLGVELEAVKYVTAFVFTALHITGIGTLLKAFTGSKYSFACGAAVGTPLMYTTFHLSLHPAIASFMLFPAILAVLEWYRQTNLKRYLLLYVVFGWFVIYAHPLTTVFLTVLLSVICIFGWVFGRLNRERVPSISTRMIAVIPPLWFIWLINFRQTRTSIERVFTSDDGPPPGVAELGEASAVSFDPLLLATKFVQLYGVVFIYLVIAGLFGLLVLYAARKRKMEYDKGLFTIQFFIGFLIAAVFLTQNLIVRGRIRISRYMILMAVILFALAFLHYFNKRDKLVPIALTACILLAAGLGANAAYEPNNHLTYTEYEGTEFLASNHEPGVDAHSYKISHKMERYALGRQDPGVYPPLFNISKTIPRNLGYPTNGTESTAADTFGRSYVITKSYDLEYYSARYFSKEQQDLLYLYGQTHVDRMGRDDTVDKIYSNGGYDVWSVTPSAPSQIPENRD